MATRDQRLAARRRARELQVEDKKKFEEMLRRRREATEEVLVRLSQVDEVHAAAGKALQELLNMGDQKDSLAETFGLPKSAVDGYLRSWRESESERGAEDASDGSGDADAPADSDDVVSDEELGDLDGGGTAASTVDASV